MLSPYKQTEANNDESFNIEKSDNQHDDIHIDISDALCEKDKVKFTVHIKAKLSIFHETDFSVSRQHEEFIWLNDQLNDNEDYAGLIIPPAPPRPDFDSSRAKLQKLSESEGLLTTEEHEKMKQELEAEYLAIFKKTVSIHEVYLQRLASHPILRNDHYLRVFLEYKEDLSVRGKNTKEQIAGFFKTLTKTADIASLNNHKETDEFFDKHKQFLLAYNGKIKDTTTTSEKNIRALKNVSDSYIKLSSSFNSLSTLERSVLPKYFILLANFFEKIRKSESRTQTDIDLKLTDTLRYYMCDSKAALDLMHRRSRCLADFDAANKNLDRARQKNKDLQQAETAQQTVKMKFEKISEKAKDELNDFKIRRVQTFRKNFVELSELQIKHAKAQIQIIKDALQQFERL